jgi:hypothetical protein
MRLTLLVLTVFLLSITAQAQKTEKVLLTRMHDDGMLYHLKQLELDASKKAELTVDFTYLPTEKTDSARILIALAHPELKGRPKSVSISFSNTSVGYAGDAMHVMYVEKDKKNWITRIEVSMEEEAFLELLTVGDFTLKMNFEEGECSGKSTKKAAQVYREARTIIQYN